MKNTARPRCRPLALMVLTFAVAGVSTGCLTVGIASEARPKVRNVTVEVERIDHAYFRSDDRELLLCASGIGRTDGREERSSFGWQIEIDDFIREKTPELWPASAAFADFSSAWRQWRHARKCDGESPGSDWIEVPVVTAESLEGLVPIDPSRTGRQVCDVGVSALPAAPAVVVDFGDSRVGFVVDGVRDSGSIGAAFDLAGHERREAHPRQLLWALAPASAAIDLATLPIQALVVYQFWPEC